MTALALEVVGSRPEPHAAVPTLALRIRATAPDGVTVHALALRTQVRIEPQRRRYTPEEEERLLELFGETPRWGDTLRPFLWTHVATTVPGFTGATEFDLHMECSYDFEVAAAKYLHALGDGEIPLVLLWSGTTFNRGEQGFAAAPIAWDLESAYRLPVAVWRGVVDRYFPNSGWLRLQRETIDRLQRYRAQRALPTFDQALEVLLKEKVEPEW